MDEREQLRMQLTSEVMRLARHRSVRDAIPPLWEDGSAPLVVALPDDTLEDVSRRAETVGGRAHLIVVDHLGAGEVRIRILRLEPEAKAIGELAGMTAVSASAESTVGILLADMQVGNVARYRTYDRETVIRFVNDSVQPVRA